MERRDRSRIADIALESVDSGQRPLGMIELFLIPAGDDDRVTTLKKLLRQFKADAARSPSD